MFITLALVATGVAVEFALHRFVQGQIDQRLDGQLLTIRSALEAEPNGAIVLGRSVDAPPFDNPRTGWFWLVRTPDRTWRAGGLRSAEVDLSPVPPGPFDHPRPIDAHGPDGRELRARADHVVIAGQDSVIIAAAPLEALNGPLRDALFPLFTSLLVLGGGLILATLIQVRLGLRPLAGLPDSIAAVRTGQIDRLPTQQPAEVRPLVHELNRLLDQHSANLERARRHVANLAHALKTPLATLTLALNQATADPDDHLRDLVLAMDRRIRHHLARARVAALGTPTRGGLLLAPRIADHVAAFAKIYADKRIECHVSIPPGTAVACDPQDVDEMAGNVLDNAFKWGRSEVSVAASTEPDRIRFSVEDDGPGVDPASGDAILKRGQRLDESVAGDGFGLAIVQEVVELYGGEILLSRRSPTGLRVTLTLPAVPGSRPVS